MSLLAFGDALDRAGIRGQLKAYSSTRLAARWPQRAYQIKRNIAAAQGTDVRARWEKELHKFLNEPFEFDFPLPPAPLALPWNLVLVSVKRLYFDFGPLALPLVPLALVLLPLFSTFSAESVEAELAYSNTPGPKYDYYYKSKGEESKFKTRSLLIS